MTPIKYSKIEYKYNLDQTFTVLTRITGFEVDYGAIKLDAEGFLTLRKGFKWDGASGPAIDTESFMRGSAVHDAFYNMMKVGLIPTTKRKAADKELRRWCKIDGMSYMRRHYVYRAVRWFGDDFLGKVIPIEDNL